MVEIPMYLKDFTKINKISKDAVLLKVYAIAVVQLFIC